VIVRDAQARRALEGELFSADREYPIVVVSARDGQPLVALGKLAETTQSELACYYVPGKHVLRKLNGVLGKPLAVWPESLRIFWPGLKTTSSPNDHPFVPVLHNEPEEIVLDAFGTAFDLSRPRVRRARELQLDAGALLRRLDDLRVRVKEQDARHTLRRRRLRRNSHSLARRRAQERGDGHK
jgi:hypothetical protein